MAVGIVDPILVVAVPGIIDPVPGMKEGIAAGDHILHEGGGVFRPEGDNFFFYFFIFLFFF